MDPDIADITALFDRHFSADQHRALVDFLAADRSLAFVRAMTADGQELLVFRDSHPVLSAEQPRLAASARPGVVQRTQPAANDADLVESPGVVQRTEGSETAITGSCSAQIGGRAGVPAGVVQRTAIAGRRQAVDDAVASNGLSGFTPSAFGRGVLERWIDGDWTADQAVETIKAHYAAIAGRQASDMAAKPNLLGITDSQLLRQFEADVVTLRLAELQSRPRPSP